MLLLVAVLVAAGIAFVISRAIANGTGAMLRAADGIADGDVDQDVDVRSRDEIGKTAAAFTRMIAYLKEMATAAERLREGVRRLPALSGEHARALTGVVRRS